MLIFSGREKTFPIRMQYLPISSKIFNTPVPCFISCRLLGRLLLFYLLEIDIFAHIVAHLLAHCLGFGNGNIALASPSEIVPMLLLRSRSAVHLLLHRALCIAHAPYKRQPRQQRHEQQRHEYYCQCSEQVGRNANQHQQHYACQRIAAYKAEQ